MKKSWYLIFVFLLLVFIPVFGYVQSHNLHFKDFFKQGSPVAHIGNIPLSVEIANTDGSRTQGLSGREKLEHDGMLFVFPFADYHGIWMKDMLFPIDIIWVGEDKKIIGIEKNVQPGSYPTVFRPSAPAKYVIETNIHFSDSYDFHAGQTVTLPEEFIAK